MNKKTIILILIILEGIHVISFEIISVKIIQPYYGGSVDVWASGIGFTILGLACGYYASRYLFEKINSITSLIKHFTIISFISFLLFILEVYLLNYVIYLDYHIGLILTNLFFLFPIQILLGTIMPLSVGLYSKESKNDSIGLLFFISTISSMIAGQLIGFLFLPSIGSKSIILNLICLEMIILLSILLIIKNKYFLYNLIFLIFILIYYVSNSTYNSNNSLYYSEGFLGKIEVKEFSFFDGQNQIGRKILTNNSPQTVINIKNGSSLGDYPYLISEILKNQKIKKNALLLGFGGGTVAFELEKLGYIVDAVEIDERMLDVSKRFFYPKLKTNVIINDGRYFINKLKKQYSVIIIDVFNSENPPHQLFTFECFDKIKKNIDTNGIVLINFNGFINGKISEGSNSVYKTLKASGFNVKIFPTDQIESQRNCIYVASYNKEIPNIIRYRNNYISKAINNKTIKFGEILYDSKPNLDILNRNASLKWRKYGIENMKNEL